MICWITTPSQPRVTLPAGSELRQDLLGHVDRNGEADRVRARVDRGVDADHLAREVEQRAARVAGVDGGVGLDEVVVAALRRCCAVLGAHDAGGHGVLEAEGVADRDHPVARAHLRRSRRAEAPAAPCRSSRGSARCRSWDRGRRSRPRARCRREAHLDLVDVLDDVVVGDDVAVGRDHEAGAEARHLELALLEELAEAAAAEELARGCGGRAARRPAAGIFFEVWMLTTDGRHLLGEVGEAAEALERDAPRRRRLCSFQNGVALRAVAVLGASCRRRRGRWLRVVAPLSRTLEPAATSTATRRAGALTPPRGARKHHLSQTTHRSSSRFSTSLLDRAGSDERERSTWYRPRPR